MGDDYGLLDTIAASIAHGAEPRLNLPQRYVIVRFIEKKREAFVFHSVQERVEGDEDALAVR